MSHRMDWRLLSALLFGLMAGAAEAGQVFHVSGSVANFTQNSGNVLDYITAGDAFVGTITFDDSAMPAQSSSGYAYYNNLGAITFDLTIGGSLQLTRTGEIAGANYNSNTAAFYEDSQGANYDEMYLRSDSSYGANESGSYVSRGESAIFSLVDLDYDVAASDALTSTSLAGFSPDLSKFTSKYVLFSKWNNISSTSYPFTTTYFDSNYSLRLTIDSLTVGSQAIATPEPGTIALAASALPVGLGLWLKRRRKAPAA